MWDSISAVNDVELVVALQQQPVGDSDFALVYHFDFVGGQPNLYVVGLHQQTFIAALNDVGRYDAGEFPPDGLTACL